MIYWARKYAISIYFGSILICLLLPAIDRIQGERNPKHWKVIIDKFM